MSKTIPYVDKTWNPMVGCSHEQSPGCANCYAARLASTRLAHLPAYEGLASKGRWAGRVRIQESKLCEPLHWRKPSRIFVCDMGDLFHEQVSNEFIAAVFGIMAGAPQHTFLVLTKRAERMRKWFEWAGQKIGPRTWRKWANEACNWGTENDVPIRWARIAPADWPWPLPNVWLGVTCCNQAEADERIPHLLATPAAHRWVSAEPLLGPIDFDLPRCDCCGEVADGRADDGTPWCIEHDNECSYGHWLDPLNDGISWVVAGGESGSHARPCALEWLDSIQQQCSDAGVPFYRKQLGAYIVSEERAEQNPDGSWTWQWRGNFGHPSGADPSQWFDDMRVRQIPEPEAML